MNSINSNNKTDNDLIICRCEGVRLGQIQSTIRRSGVQTVNQIKKLTRAGMGPCQGRTCARIVETILAASVPESAGTEPFQARPPVRGIAVGTLAAAADQFDEPTGPVKVRALHKPDAEMTGKKG
ncbi:MAG: (2Fe-2S)-binding protein [Desulfobacterales bacterium]|nr:MAG: (2Fe-2S)-binding protein [Desulfobacterales bacterium]